MTTVVCVDAGNYLGRGNAYVAALYDCVGTHMDRPFTFQCFTDRMDANYPMGVIKRPLPAGISGWYNKLYLFSKGLFEEDERIIYFDLDTVITGPLDQLTAYSGHFAMLRDLTMPSRLASGVMAWAGCVYTSLWHDWLAAGGPNMAMGDQEWIEQHTTACGYLVDILQDIVKGIYSYKVSCKRDLPPDAAIVCFHGKPRPHEVKHHWMKYSYGS